MSLVFSKGLVRLTDLPV